MIGTDIDKIYQSKYYTVHFFIFNDEKFHGFDISSKFQRSNLFDNFVYMCMLNLYFSVVLIFIDIF